ncbi:MAG: hypothetical protein CL566_11310 [Alphaproteobacteria bacterium]|nr:hypothetical protein [Alphaproteobacteria bacterium]
MAHRRAIVTTPVFGIPEQLGSDPLVARRYEPGRTDSLAGHLAELGEDVSLRAEMGDAAHSRLAALSSFDGMLDRYQQVFEGCFQPPPEDSDG